MPEVEIPKEKWSGKIQEVTLGGGGRKTVTVGGATTLPFLKFEGDIPNRPAIAIEVQDHEPVGWAPTLLSAWGNVVRDPATWAKKAVEFGADIILLRLQSAHPDEGNTGAAEARQVVDRVLSAVDLPLIILGPGVAEKDNEVLIAASEVARGQRVALGNCEEKNYRTIAAVCISDSHVAVAKTPVDINLAKQLNIMLSDIGVSLDSILMDPTTGALGYGLEYTYSIMERLRIAALTGDKICAIPMIGTPGEEVWKLKEAKVAEGVPQAWGDIGERALIWEELTATALLHSGADILYFRHPRAAELLKATIDGLMG